MQYDVFICHASEDKSEFVRPLAEALRLEHVEVWFDEFTLKLGSSIRRSIDLGLRQSRFGVVVLSPAFFAKAWPQYELDGLTEREMSNRHDVILPIWRGVTHDDVMQYSPSLAGRRAITASNVDDVVRELVGVLHPEGSPLIIARDIVADWQDTVPVVTDSRWLEVVQASNRMDAFGGGIPPESMWSFWSFPLPPRGGDALLWGERLAWSFLQLQWVEAAERNTINLLSSPPDVHRFVDSSPGLFETASFFHQLLIEYAPQLTIRGCEGRFGETIESEYQKASTEYRQHTEKFSCPTKWALREPNFGGHEPRTVAHAYFDSGEFGPPVSPYEHAEHLLWLLSDKSAWLPRKARRFLLHGVAALRWPWNSNVGEWDTCGQLTEKVYECVDHQRTFRWTSNARNDLREYIAVARLKLRLPETVKELESKFVANKVVHQHIAAESARSKPPPNSR